MEGKYEKMIFKYNYYENEDLQDNLFRQKFSDFLNLLVDLKH